MWRMSLLEIQHVDYKEERREIKGEWLPSLPSCLLLSSSLKCLLSKFRKHWLKSLRSQVGDVHVRRRYHMIGSGVVCGKWYILEKFSYPVSSFLKKQFFKSIYAFSHPMRPTGFQFPNQVLKPRPLQTPTKSPGRSLFFLLFIIMILVEQTCLQDAKIQRQASELL